VPRIVAALLDDHRASLKEFQGPYNHPEGVDGAKRERSWLEQHRNGFGDLIFS
jgi:hypothetical protein